MHFIQVDHYAHVPNPYGHEDKGQLDAYDRDEYGHMEDSGRAEGGLAHEATALSNAMDSLHAGYSDHYGDAPAYDGYGHTPAYDGYGAAPACASTHESYDDHEYRGSDYRGAACGNSHDVDYHDQYDRYPEDHEEPVFEHHYRDDDGHFDMGDPALDGAGFEDEEEDLDKSYGDYGRRSIY